MTELKEQTQQILDENWIEEDKEEEEYNLYHFKYDPEKINIITREPTIEVLLRRIDESVLDLAPDFQRQANIWKDDVKSRLIESILIRIPLPAFYIDATDEENWLVVDGLQRLSALRQFVSENKLRLSGLEYLTDLEGKTYNELEPKYRRRILENQPTVYLIEKGTPDIVKYNIFKRINTGGTPLSNQELRHALNPGKANKFLAKLVNLQEFRQLVNLSPTKKNRMEDREFVLGFLAFFLTSYQEYTERDEFLNKAFHKANQLSDNELNSIEEEFKRAMTSAYEIFGDNAFRKLSRKVTKKYPVNKALFEAWSVSLSRLSDEEIQKLKERKQALIDNFIDYADNDPEFLTAISQAANKVAYRFSKISQIIQEVIS